MKKKVIAALLIAALSVAGLAACSAGTASEEGAAGETAASSGEAEAAGETAAEDYRSGQREDGDFAVACDERRPPGAAGGDCGRLQRQPGPV